MADIDSDDRALFSSCGLVVVAAGRGTRFGGYKQLVPLMGKPLLVQTLLAFVDLPFASHVVVVPDEFLQNGTWKKLVAETPALLRYKAVSGLQERALSVREGLRAVPSHIPLVAVQDGVRPLPPLGALEECIRLLIAREDLSAAIVATKVTDTIKRIAHDGQTILNTEDREQLLRAETPQVCRRLELLKALAVPQNIDARDEAEALERTGHETACVVHGGFNPKITHPADMAIVTSFLQANFDTHPEPHNAGVGHR